MNDITTYSEKIFEDIRHVNEYGEEFWYARELQGVLEYTKWSNFCKVIEKAKIACESASNDVESNFADVGKKVAVGAGIREIDDMILSRYACTR